MRSIIAVIAGIICGAFFIGLSGTIAYAVFPADVPFPVTLEEQKAFLSHVPGKARAVIFIGWLFSAFITGSITTLIQGRTSWKVPVITACVLQLFIWMSMAGLSYPVWMWLLSTLLFVPAAFGGYFFFKKHL